MSHMLDEHGTKLLQLTPASIVQAAEVDLCRRERNCAPLLGREHYAFHRAHVRKSKFVVDLLTIALRDRQRGADSGKRWTRLIYQDEAALRQALESLKLRDAA